MSNTDVKTDHQVHLECLNRFIDLANSMKEEGVDVKLVAYGLMSASGYYTTFAHGGNSGGLTDSGIEKVTSTYKNELERIQKLKKQQIES